MSTATPVTQPRGLGRSASHIVREGGGFEAMTRCGLTVGEPAPAGTIVQKPGLRWPLPRCKHCTKETP